MLREPPSPKNAELELDGAVGGGVAENEIAGSWFGDWVQAVLDREFRVTVAGGSGIQINGGGYNSGVAGDSFWKLEAMAQIFRMTKSKGQLAVCEEEGCQNKENAVGLRSPAAAQVSEEEIQLENAVFKLRILSVSILRFESRKYEYKKK